ncbi:hypothetical protein [uncultured Cellulomonas sp.]|uniref:hypothetical protein n=1 Tax=uncultured Cellulomonas sp. TaxID=189682 RepID=UPI0028EDDDEA|nr:hypothetical protein [uncultured Cellulomonas sp.]
MLARWLHRPRLRSATAALALALAGLTLAAAVPPPATTAADPGAGLRTAPGATLIGAHVDKGSSADAESAVTAFEGALDRRLSVERWYSRWDDVQPAAPVVTAVARGRTPLLSFWPRRLDGSTVTWAAIARGDQDPQIRRHAEAVRSLGVPTYVAFHQEMDISPSWGTPEQFRAAWRRYVEVFRAQGATNAVFTWVVTVGSFGPYVSTAGADAYYPGDDVVDRVGLNAYNWFGCSAHKVTDWRSLARVTADFRAWAQARGKTPLLAEFGTVEDPAQPTRKAQWLTDAFTLFRDWPELEAAVYFQGTGTCTWTLSTSTAATAAFGAGARTPAAVGRPTAWLIPSVRSGGAPLTVSFDLSRSTGAVSANRTGIVSWELDPGDGSGVRTGTGQPGRVSVTYQAGTYQPRLTVRDASGATAVDSRPVKASARPTVTGSERDVASTSATLQTWVGTDGLPGGVRIAWAAEGGVEAGAVQLPVVAQTATQKLVHAATGLTPGTRYTWTATATTASGTTVMSRVLHTPGPPTVRPVAPQSVTRSAAVVALRVHPHQLATTAWVDWGPGLATRTPEVALAATTYERSATVELGGLAPATTYGYRVTATNALGTVYGPTQTLTTPP